jgi:hypothetical protein
MYRILYDFLGAEINPGDMVRREKLENGKMVLEDYFYYGITDSKKGFLYICDNNGNINLNSRAGFPVDSGMSLSHDDSNFRWIRLGTKEEWEITKK